MFELISDAFGGYHPRASQVRRSWKRSSSYERWLGTWSV